MTSEIREIFLFGWQVESHDSKTIGGFSKGKKMLLEKNSDFLKKNLQELKSPVAF
jgi:hypothetical protein